MVISGFEYQPGYLPYDEYRIHISVDSGLQWQDLTGNLPLTYENWVMEELFVKFINNRLFIWNPDYGLWYRDDLLTGTPESVPAQTFSQGLLRVFPNPASDECFLQLTLDQTSLARIRVYNQFGQLLRVTEEKLPEGRSQIPFRTEGLRPGTYLINLQAGNKSLNTKFVVL